MRVLAAIPLSVLALAALELTRLPSAHLDAGRLAAAFAQLLGASVSTFWTPSLVFVGAAAALVWEERRPGWLPRAALFGLGVAQASLAREVLIEYGPFAHSLAANVGFVVLGLGLGALHVWLSRAGRVALYVGVLAILSGLVVSRAHYLFLVGLYPTLHQSLLRLSFVALALGLGLVFQARQTEWRRLGRIALGLGLVLSLFAVVELPAAAWARPIVIAYTELGRGAGVAAALERDRAFLLPRSLPGPRQSTLLRPDEDAEARFAEHSGLPELGVSLDDHDLLLILVDTTRFDRTSLARGADGPTPNLLAFAERGSHVFTRAYSPSNGTFPTVASMFSMAPTSFAELDLEPRFWHGRLREGRATAPMVLRDAGRSTFWVGHDHGGCFSEHARGVERGFDELVLIPETRDDPDDEDVDERIADAAIAALGRQRSRFFGLVFFVSPHADYKGSYDEELARFDRQLGRLLEAVNLEETIVVVASDHGEGFGEHGFDHHLTSLYDEQIHVPFVVHVPGVEGARHEAPTSISYLFPWLLAAGGANERRAAREALRLEIGPMMRTLDGAVLSEMIGPRHQQVALIWEDTTVIYDMLADLARVFDASDVEQLHDLREDDPARLERVLPFAGRYRRARYEGRRFRFVEEEP